MLEIEYNFYFIKIKLEIKENDCEDYFKDLEDIKKEKVDMEVEFFVLRSKIFKFII